MIVSRPTVKDAEDSREYPLERDGSRVTDQDHPIAVVNPSLAPTGVVMTSIRLYMLLINFLAALIVQYMP